MTISKKMSQKTSEAEICQAVLDFTSDGTYPESEEVVTANFPASGLSKELDLISRVREEVEVRP